MSATLLAPETHSFAPSVTNSALTEPKLRAVSGSSDETPAFVIGDLHGHLDRFEALLKQEGLLDRCETCDGSGMQEEWHPGATVPEYQGECYKCRGDGWARTSKPAKVILVGDIGDFSKKGSPTGDLLTWLAAVGWADVILWGNHDRAVVQERHAHKGYLKPGPELYRVIDRARYEGKLKLAYAIHGFLITHAGLALAFREQRVHPELKRDPAAFAKWINQGEDPNAEITENQLGIRDAIGSKRSGGSQTGGILWRDISEKLYPFRQIFGHSADHQERQVRYCGRNAYTRSERAIYFENLSYCIDIGGPDDVGGAKCLAGIWLPSEKIVRVDL